MNSTKNSFLSDEEKSLIALRSKRNSPKSPGPFQTWRDLLITPAAEILIVASAVLCTMSLQKRLQFGIAEWLLFFWIFQTCLTLISLKLLRTFFPFKPGTFNSNEHEVEIYLWKLQAFLYVMNLSPLTVNALLPTFLRQWFYQILGAKIGPGIVSIGGRIMEPSLVSIGPNAIVGDDVLILPHALSVGATEVLILAPIRIERGAVVGARSLVMPGVTIGENSMIKAMSLVTRNTRVPAGEIWGGIPARKLADVSTLEFAQNEAQLGQIERVVKEPA
jgi:carbonic anhydrase/acetyltransferase-like protein (isoleucine patch superfamily)